LIKETEYKKREQGLGGGANLEEKDENQKEFIDERMASHEALYAVKEPLAFNQLFEPKEDTKTPNKILILGRAGIGKSVLCQYLAVQWASDYECKDEEQKPGEIGNYLRQKFDAVFWVRLREVAAGSPDNNTVAKVLHQFCVKGVHKPPVEELVSYIQSYSAKVLFIVDGYDEITDLIGQARYAHLTSFLDDLAHHQHILVTSRPLAIDSLGQSRMKFDRRLENMGFTNENVETYIRYFMQNTGKKNQAAPMLKFLKTHPNIWSIAHVPINLELLSWLWSQGEEGKLLFKPGEKVTLSKLYQEIVIRIQQAYAEKQKQFRINLSPEVQFDPINDFDLINEFLECLAFSAMKTESLLISEDQLKKSLTKTLKKYYPQKFYNELQLSRDQEKLLKSSTDRLGFLRSTKEGGRSQLDQPHYFIHLSFQEFYAARYIARILSESVESQKKADIIEHVRVEKYTSHYQLMLWMTSGLLYRQGVDKEGDFTSLEQFWGAILSEPRDLIGFHHLVLVMHCLDECEADDNLLLHKELIDQQLRWFNFYITKRKGFYLFYEKYIDELACCPFLQGSKLIIDRILNNLKDKDEYIRRASVKALGKLQNKNSEIVNVLLAAFKDENVRHIAIEELSKLHNPSGEVVNTLLTYLKDESKDVRNWASYTLGNFKNPSGETINALLIASKDRDEDVRHAAVSALGKLQSQSGDEVANALLIALKDEKKSVRCQAVFALSQLQNPNGKVINAFLTTLKDEDASVRYEAVSALDKLQNPNGEVVKALLTIILNDEVQYMRRAAASALSKLQSPNINALLRDLKDEDRTVRYQAVSALGKFQNPNGEMIYALLNALKDADDSVKSHASNALNKLRNLSDNGEAIDAFLTALRDENKDMRREAVHALGNQNPSSEVVNVLLTALRDENKDVRREAVHALGNQNPSSEVVNVLLTVLRDENKDVRRAAVYALSRLQNPNGDVINALLKVLKDQNEKEDVRYATVETLGRLKNLRTDHLRIVFDKLIYHPWIQAYLSRYFEENYLLCIDYKKEQVILSLSNKIHKIPFQFEILIYLEEQVKSVAERLHYPLDLIMTENNFSSSSIRSPSSRPRGLCDYETTVPLSSENFLLEELQALTKVHREQWEQLKLKLSSKISSSSSSQSPDLSGYNRVAPMTAIPIENSEKLNENNQELKNIYDVAISYENLGALHSIFKKPECARTHWLKALAIYQKLGRQKEIARAEQALAGLLLPPAAHAAGALRSSPASLFEEHDQTVTLLISSFQADCYLINLDRVLGEGRPDKRIVQKDPNTFTVSFPSFWLKQLRKEAIQELSRQLAIDPKTLRPR
jgi:HEAT repeat protein